ncbi:MAG: NADH-ubiquinone oxidoreductase-F iron-sulfur binding region domain-containing protein [Candidatus Sedimenticola sp. (ex Thyasira tokunagai)]
MSKNIRALSARSPEGNTLFAEYGLIADKHGTLSSDEIRKIAEKHLIAPGVIQGSHSFYDFLRETNRGKRAYRCKGTACLLSQKTQPAHADLAAHYSTSEVGEMACVGRCYRGGGMVTEDKTFDCETLADLKKTHSKPHNREHVPFFAAASINVFGSIISDIDAFYQSLPQQAGVIVQELERSGLRGRGGAGFPFASKLKACAEMPEGKKYIVCNADEGDPGAFSDRYLLEDQPHRVLGGMLLAVLACGARHGFLYIRAEYPEAIELMTAAIAQYRTTLAYRQSGVEFHVIRGAGAYVCGEETALLNSIEGLRPEVRVRPPYPAQAGLFGMPTLLSNVETFAALPWIAENGGEAFATIGNGVSTGSKLISLDHSFNHPGVYEVDMGLPLDRLISDLAGGFRYPVKGLQVGGPLGGVLPIDKSAELTIDFESFDQAGFLLGHAGIIAIPKSFPMIEFLRHLFDYMADESCGKCVPCRIGTRKGSDMLNQASPKQPLDGRLLSDLLETLALGSLCALGGGLPLPVRNILEYFPDEMELFITKGTK